MLTRHARRIYAGGIPPRASEIEIANFFNDVVTRALLPARLDGPPVIKIYLNIEKCYAFVEFATIELTTACMQLDGIKFDPEVVAALQIHAAEVSDMSARGMQAVHEMMMKQGG